LSKEQIGRILLQATSSQSNGLSKDDADLLAREVLRLADENAQQRMSLEVVQRVAKRWNDLLELCGHLGDSSETTVTLSQDDACRTQHIRVGDKRFYGTSWAQALEKAVAGDES
jgi:hypothetical protein